MCIAQDATVIRSELQLLEGPINDTDRACTYNWISFNYAYENPDEGIKYGRLGRSLLKKLDFKKGIGDAHSNMGFCFTCKSEFDSANVHYSKSIEAFQNIQNNCWTKVPTSNLGANYIKQRDLANALIQYLEAARLEEGYPDRGFKSTSIYSVGIVYHAMKKSDKAIPYFEQTCAIDLANSDTSKMAERLAALGNALTGIGRFEDAQKKFKEAFSYFAKLDDKYRKAITHIGLARLKEKTGYEKEAIYEAEIAREVFKNEDRKSDWFSACVLLGELYSKNENWVNSFEVLNEGVKIAEELQVKSARLKINEKLTLASMKSGPLLWQRNTLKNTLLCAKLCSMKR